MRSCAWKAMVATGRDGTGRDKGGGWGDVPHGGSMPPAGCGCPGRKCWVVLCLPLRWCHERLCDSARRALGARESGGGGDGCGPARSE